MILRLLLSFFVGLTFVTASYAAIEDQISEFMLDNGMQVVVIEDHRAPVVVHWCGIVQVPLMKHPACLV